MNDPYYKAVAIWAFFDELEKEATWKDVKEVGEDAADAVKDTVSAGVEKAQKVYKSTGIPEGRIGKMMKALARMLGKKKEAALAKAAAATVEDIGTGAAIGAGVGLLKNSSARTEFNKDQFKQLLKNILVVGGGAALGTAAGHAANELVVKGTRRMSTPWKMRVTRHLPRAAAAMGGIGGILLAARRMKAQQLIEEKGNERRRLEQSTNRAGGSASR